MAEGNFTQRLASLVAAHGALCVGVDPSRELLAAWGLGDDPDGLSSFCDTLLEATTSRCAVIKPQIAYFERHGSAGYRVLERVIADARERGLLVIADAKRGDIDATQSAYAQAWLEPGSSLEVDAMTVSGYLGVGAMAEMIELSRSAGKGLFVVAASSNPEGRDLQSALREDGRSVEQGILEEIEAMNRMAGEAPGSGTLGAVVGATRLPEGLSTLSGPVLVPGVGAQGGGGADAARVRAGMCHGSICVNVSRAVLREGPVVSDLIRAIEHWQGELAVAEIA